MKYIEIFLLTNSLVNIHLKLLHKGFYRSGTA